jgi:hypothetical protein
MLVLANILCNKLIIKTFKVFTFKMPCSILFNKMLKKLSKVFTFKILRPTTKEELNRH